MKNLSLGLNVLLVLAVGFLYYYNFKGAKNAGINKMAVSAGIPDSNFNKGRIAYVELDSLYEKISYIKQVRLEMEAKKKKIDGEWETGMKELETKKNDFLKKGTTATQDEIQKIQEYLAGMQQQIEQKRQMQGQALSEESFTFTDKIQKQLKSFLNDYNQQKKFEYILTTGTGLDYLVYKDSSLNITNDVIKGMNEKMKANVIK